MNTQQPTIADIFSPYLTVIDNGIARINPESICSAKNMLFTLASEGTPLVVSENWNALQKNGSLIDFFAGDIYHLAEQPQDNLNQVQLRASKNDAVIIVSLECFLNAFHAAPIACASAA